MSRASYQIRQWENTQVAHFIKDAPKEGIRAVKTHMDETKSGEPDCYCSFKGRCIVVEFKQTGQKPSELQLYKLMQWARAGALTVVADSSADAISLIKRQWNKVYVNGYEEQNFALEPSGSIV